MSSTPPRLLLALALVGAGGLTQLAVLLAMFAVPDGVGAAGTGLGLLTRIQVGTRVLDVGILLLVPLAVLLARLVEPHAASPAHQATRTALVGAAAVGSASAFLLTLRLVADLAGDPRLLVRTAPGAVVYDLGLLLVAGVSAFWAYRELQRAPAASAEPGPAPPAGPGPAPPASPGGFPSGPPLAGPPPQPPPPGG